TIAPCSFKPPSPTALYTLSLHDALPICRHLRAEPEVTGVGADVHGAVDRLHRGVREEGHLVNGLDSPDGAGHRLRHVALVAAHKDRKSTRLNSSHVAISYAVFCLKKKKK